MDSADKSKWTEQCLSLPSDQSGLAEQIGLPHGAAVHIEHASATRYTMRRTGTKLKKFDILVGGVWRDWDEYRWTEKRGGPYDIPDGAAQVDTRHADLRAKGASNLCVRIRVCPE